MTWFSIHSRVAMLMGWAMSWNVPSFRLRLGMAMKSPEAPSMIFNPRITKALSRVMLAKPFNLLSSRKVILISEISKILPLRGESNHWWPGARKPQSSMISTPPACGPATLTK